MTEASAGSALSRIEARRRAAAQSLTLDLPVPRYDPPIYVRVRPIEPSEVEAINKRFKSLKTDKTVTINAAALAEVCLGLFEKDEDGDLVGLNEESDPSAWPRFDESLAEIVGVEAGSAVDMVRGTYLTGYDIISAGARVLEWSGMNGALDEDDSGN